MGKRRRERKFREEQARREAQRKKFMEDFEAHRRAVKRRTEFELAWKAGEVSILDYSKPHRDILEDQVRHSYDDWYYDDYARYKRKPYTEIKPRENLVKKHNIKDLVAKVCALPLSSPLVITRFNEKLLAESNDGFTVSEEKVIYVVDNWPSACQTGKDDFLASNGIKRNTLVKVTVHMTYTTGGGPIVNNLPAVNIPGVHSKKALNTLGNVELTINDVAKFLEWTGGLYFNKHIDGLGTKGVDVKGKLTLTNA